MAGFVNTDNKRNSARDAANFLDILRSIYQQGKLVQEYVVRYQAGTDTFFNNALNNFHDAPERAKLVTMIGGMNSLLATWEADADIRTALGLDPLP